MLLEVSSKILELRDAPKEKREKSQAGLFSLDESPLIGLLYDDLTIVCLGGDPLQHWGHLADNQQRRPQLVAGGDLGVDDR